MKSHMQLLQSVLADCSNNTQGCASTIRDFKTITERVKHEGLSFLTITLPQFGKDFEKSLDQGVIAQSSFASFAKNGRLPKFLSGFVSLVFNSGDGLLVDDPSIDAIRSVRQITNLFGKTYLPCSDAREFAAFRKFIEIENQMKESDQSIDYDELRRCQRIAMLVFGDALSVVDRKIFEGNLIPKHGPGATADRLRGNSKYDLRMWTERLQEVFEHSEYLFPSVSHFLESQPLHLVDPGSELPVRVITVPKTLKTPRIIAIEPAVMQYMQQAILRELVFELERPDNLSSSFLGFTHQEPNQQMACEGSLTGSLATLDLSEASDRVSNQHVRYLFAPFFWFSRGLDVTRSRKADVPGFGVIRLSKFASMGSALCFPIEAMVFLTIVLRGIEKELSRPLTVRDLHDLVGKVRVYGDDIIIPVDYVQSVVSTLHDFGHVVNENKSFWTGRFRESCGKEFYAGHDVSVVKARRLLPSRRSDVPEIVSAVSLRNQLNAACAWETVEYLDRHIERFIPLPYVLSTSQGLGRLDLFGSYDSSRSCPNLQRPLVKAAVVVGRPPYNLLEGPGALLKWFLLKDSKEPLSVDHLERYGRPDAVYLKHRWVSPY
jgi:hypothetical protein